VKLLRRRAETRTEFLGRTDRARQSASAGTLEADDLLLVQQGVGVASGSPMAIRVRYRETVDRAKLVDSFSTDDVPAS
jgi:hypothetical protein